MPFSRILSGFFKIFRYTLTIMLLFIYRTFFLFGGQIEVVQI